MTAVAVCLVILLVGAVPTRCFESDPSGNSSGPVTGPFDPVYALRSYLAGLPSRHQRDTSNHYDELFPPEADLDIDTVAVSGGAAVRTRSVKSSTTGTTAKTTTAATTTTSSTTPKRKDSKAGVKREPKLVTEVPLLTRTTSTPRPGPPPLTTAKTRRISMLAREQTISAHKMASLPNYVSTEGENMGRPCQFEGNWTSETAGVKLSAGLGRFGVLNMRMGADAGWKEEPLFEQKRWRIKGEAPLGELGPFCLTALNHRDNMLATFIGECRTFEGYDTVVGIWVVARPALDYRDTYTALTVLHDVFRKDNQL